MPVKHINPLGLPSHDDIIELVKIESQMRFSKEYIDKCNQVKDEPNGWLRITGEMQQQIITDYGFKGVAVPIALNMLRRAQYLYPDNPHVQNLVYVKNNKANMGTFKAGDIIKDVELWNLCGTEMNKFSGLLSKDKINIVLSASHT